MLGWLPNLPVPCQVLPAQVQHLQPALCSHPDYWGTCSQDRGTWSAPSPTQRGTHGVVHPGLQPGTSQPVFISMAAGRAQTPSCQAPGLLCWQEARPAGSKCVIGW